MSINLALLNAKEAGFYDKLEIIVSDWGSDEPLSEALSLVPEAEGRVIFVHIPPAVARKEQKDSKFPEVLALNAAARRASGEYIGRIDNDTVVGPNFFRCLDNLQLKGSANEIDLKDSFLFVERKSIPYRISKLSLPLHQIKRFIKFFKNCFKLESATEWGREFWWSPVGIMMFHHDIWKASRGYDERLIYWGWMEGDLALRLGQKHKVIEFSKFVGHDFYHLEHYSNLTEYKDRNGTATPRKKNEPRFDDLNYRENGENWGLSDYDLTITKYKVSTSPMTKSFPLFHLARLLGGTLLLIKDKIWHSLQGFIPAIRIFIGKIKPQ
jgi:hypothetical protein